MVLVVKAKGGLCNRLRALSSGARWAEVHGHRFAYSWPVTPSFGAALGDLFVDPFWSIPARVAAVVGRITGGYGTADTVDPGRRLQVLHTGAVLAVEDPYAALRRLQPADPLRERVDRTSATWDGPMVGVMIRAHQLAHAETLGASPPDWFFDRMESIRRAHPDVRFFLSTDSREVSGEVHRRFPGVIELRKDARYNTRPALRDATCDLLLLARTTYILGSHFSSFSEVAAVLAGHGGYETAVAAPLESLSSRLG